MDRSDIGCLSGSLDPKLLIFLVSYHLKMVLVDTQAVVAHVVDLFLTRNESVLVGECDYVNSHSLSVKRHSGVSTSSAISGMGASPDVTRAGYFIDLESHVDNQDVRGDFPPDVGASAHQSVPMKSGWLCKARNGIETDLVASQPKKKSRHGREHHSMATCKALGLHSKDASS